MKRRDDAINPMMKITISHLIKPMAGERVSGDAAIVRREGDIVLFAVVDALGHGVNAAPVADAAIENLRTTALDRSVRDIMNELHRALGGTRGAAAMICKWSVSAGLLQGVGVGNVELMSSKVKVPVMLTPGIIGSNMRTLHVFEAPVGPGSRIVLFSDGISTSIMGDDLAARPHAAACEGLMEKFRKKHDDATVMVADVEAA